MASSGDNPQEAVDEDQDAGPPLSPASLAGIRELHVDQELVGELHAKLGEEEARSQLLQNDLSKFFPEDWVRPHSLIAFNITYIIT